MADTVTQNRALYLLWLRSNFPELYRQAVEGSTTGLNGILDSIGNTFNNIVNNVTQSLPQLATTYTQYRTQQQIIEMNSQRAQQGLPPLIQQNGQLVPMTGTYSDSDYQIAQTAGLSTSSLLMIAAALGLGFLLVRSSR